MLLEFGFPTEDNPRRDKTAFPDPEATMMTTVMTRAMMTSHFSPALLLWTETATLTSRDPQSSSGMSSRRTCALYQRLWNKLLELGMAMKDTLIF